MRASVFLGHEQCFVCVRENGVHASAPSPYNRKSLVGQANLGKRALCLFLFRPIEKRGWDEWEGLGEKGGKGGHT